MKNFLDGRWTLLRILVVGNYFYPEHTGGVEIVSYNLVKHYREFGCDVRWVAADVPPNFRKVGSDDVPIRSWNFAEEKLGFPSPLPNFRALTKIINSVRWCDIVHLQDCLYPINIIVFFVAKFALKPILITQYAKIIPYKQFYKRLLQVMSYQTIGRLMFALADRVVFITQNVLDNMQYLNPAKLKNVVPLGVDTHFYSPLPENERKRIRTEISGDSIMPIILFVGRMVERKGVHLIQPLIEKYNGWHWVLVGRPDDYNPAKWLYSNLTYYQYASEQQLRDLYASADLLVHPSVGEGITLTVSESLSSGTPVIISSESLHDVAEKDRRVFIPVSPLIEEIEDALLLAFADMGELRKKGVLCREYALNRLSWKNMADRYLHILRELGR